MIIEKISNCFKKMIGIYEYKDDFIDNFIMNKEKFDDQDLEFYLQIWQHHENMFWTRFNAFITFLAIGMGFLTALILFGIIVELITLVSLVLLILGILWHSMLSRTYAYVKLYHRFVIKAQKKMKNGIERKIHIPNNKNKGFYFLERVRSIVAVNFIFWCGHIIFFLIFLVGLISTII